MMTSIALQNKMAQCTGTTSYYKRFPFLESVYTDGVKIFAESAQAHWLVNDILLFIMQKNLSNQPFLTIRLVVKGDRGELTFEDGNDTVFYKHEYKYTDCPEGEWVFFYINKVLMVANEY